MSSNLPVPSFGGGFLPSRQDRQFSRALDQIESGAALEVAGVRAAEAAELAKIEAIGAAGDTAMRETARLSAVEAHYGAAVPHAEGRLKFEADTAAMAMAERIHALGRRLR
jgi:hypothetical protein